MALVMASVVFFLKIITAILAEICYLGPGWSKFNPKVVK